jgi:hypothetical protein
VVIELELEADENGEVPTKSSLGNAAPTRFRKRPRVLGARGVARVLTLNPTGFGRYTEVRARHPNEVRA